MDIDEKFRTYLINRHIGQGSHGVFEEMEIGRGYVALGFKSGMGNAWVFIDEGYGYSEARWVPLCLFQILDNRASKYWCFAEDRYTDSTYGNLIAIQYLVIEEWAKDVDGFWERLTDFEKSECDIMNAMGQKMYLEYPIPKLMSKQKQKSMGSE